MQFLLTNTLHSYYCYDIYVFAGRGYTCRYTRLTLYYASLYHTRQPQTSVLCVFHFSLGLKLQCPRTYCRQLLGAPSVPNNKRVRLVTHCT